MKAHCTTRKSINKAMEDEWKSKQDEYYEKCKKDIIPQVVATCMYCLKIRYGFGKKRMHDFLDEIRATNELLESDLIFGKGFTTVDLIQMIKEQYNIDLDKDL